MRSKRSLGKFIFRLLLLLGTSIRACRGRVRGKLHRYGGSTEPPLSSHAGPAWVKLDKFQQALTTTMPGNIGNIIIPRLNSNPQTLSALLDLISFNITLFRQAQDLDEPDSQKLRKLDQCIAELKDSASRSQAPIDVPRQSRTPFNPIQIDDGDSSSRHAVSSDKDVAIEDIIDLMNDAVRHIDSREPARFDSTAQDRSSVRSHSDSSVISRCAVVADANDGTGTVRKSLSESSLQIQHEWEDGILKLRPRKTQWFCFDELLQYARKLGAAEIGACKVVIPQVDALKGIPDDSRPGFAYKLRQRLNQTMEVDMIPMDFKVPSSSVNMALSPSLALSSFEQLVETDKSLGGAVYCTDVFAQTEAKRNGLGLPEKSPICPLAGNKLSGTKGIVPGIHWPYAYMSGSPFGAVFSMHKEDYDLHSVSYLHRGVKYWFIIPSSAVLDLEAKFRESMQQDLSTCAQFFRETGTYVPSFVLKEWCIPFKIVRQTAGEAMITFPRVYHQGFSGGPTIAEAVNYADDHWDIDGYKERSSKCTKTPIGRNLMEMQEENEQPGSENEREEQETVRPDLRRHHRDGNRDSKRAGNLEIKAKQKRPAANTPLQSQKRRLKAFAEADTAKASAIINPKSQKELHGIFVHVSSKPTIDPWIVYQELLAQGEEANSAFQDDRALQLIRLIGAIASPDAIDQLKDACRFARQQNSQIFQSTDSLAKIWQALDRLDTAAHVTWISKRIQLVGLWKKRIEITEKLSEPFKQLALRPRRKTKYSDHSQRLNAEVLTELMRDSCPDLAPTRPGHTNYKDEYGKKLRTLQDRLSHGQRWFMLSEEFGAGILALIPTHGEYMVSNRE